MLFFADEYEDLFFNNSNKQTSSSTAMSDKEIEDMVGNPYGHTPNQDSIRTDAQLTTTLGQFDIQSTGTEDSYQISLWHYQSEDNSTFGSRRTRLSKLSNTCER